MPHNRRGFTLLEIAVVVGLVSTLALVVSRVTLDASSGNQASDLGLVRDQLAIMMRTMSSNLPVLRSSIANAQNAYLKGCICGTAACTSMQSQPFYLYDSTGANLISPKYYNTQGVGCTNSATANNCFFQVSSTALAECPPPSLPNVNLNPSWQCGPGFPNPNAAEFIQISYQVVPNSIQTASATILKTIASSVFITVSDVISAPPQSVPNIPVCP